MQASVQAFPRSAATTFERRILRAERRAVEAERRLWETMAERDRLDAGGDALAILADADRHARFGLRCPWCEGLRGSSGGYRHKPECRLRAALSSQDADAGETV